MINILFVCHGNICRSPAAEFIFKKLINERGLEGMVEVSSSATSSEELGNPVYPPMKCVLNAHGISCKGKYAKRVSDAEIESADLVIGMDDENMYMLRRRFGALDKFKMLMSYAGKDGIEVSDPWYTRDFERCYKDILEGCEGLIDSLEL